MARCRELMTTPSILIKLFEMVMCAVCTGVSSGYYVAYLDYSSTKLQVVSGTFAGFLIVSTVMWLSHVLGAPLHNYLDMALSLTGIIMFLISGAFMVEAYGWYQGKYQHVNVVVGGVLAIFTAIVFAVDLHLGCMSSRNRGNLEEDA